MKGILFIVLSGLGYGFTAVLIMKAFQSGAAPWEVLLTQNTCTFVLLSFVLFERRKYLPNLKKSLPVIIVLGLIAALLAGLSSLVAQKLAGGHDPLDLALVQLLCSSLTLVMLTAGGGCCNYGNPHYLIYRVFVFAGALYRPTVVGQRSDRLQCVVAA